MGLERRFALVGPYHRPWRARIERAHARGKSTKVENRVLSFRWPSPPGFAGLGSVPPGFARRMPSARALGHCLPCFPSGLSPVPSCHQGQILVLPGQQAEQLGLLDFPRPKACDTGRRGSTGTSSTATGEYSFFTFPRSSFRTVSSSPNVATSFPPMHLPRTWTCPPGNHASAFSDSPSSSSASERRDAPAPRMRRTLGGSGGDVAGGAATGFSRISLPAPVRVSIPTPPGAQGSTGGDGADRAIPDKDDLEEAGREGHPTDAVREGAGLWRVGDGKVKSSQGGSGEAELHRKDEMKEDTACHPAAKHGPRGWTSRRRSSSGGMANPGTWRRMGPGGGRRSFGLRFHETKEDRGLDGSNRASEAAWQEWDASARRETPEYIAGHAAADGDAAAGAGYGIEDGGMRVRISRTAALEASGGFPMCWVAVCCVRGRGPNTVGLSAFAKAVEMRKSRMRRARRPMRVPVEARSGTVQESAFLAAS